jgi:hypothetical protein
MQTIKFAVLTAFAITLTACASAPSRAPQSTPTAAPAAKSAAATNITGVWTLSVETPMGARDMKLNAMQTGEALSGTIANPRGDSAITGTVKGNAVAFSMKVNAQGQDLQIDFAGTAEGDAMKGTAQFGTFGNGTFTAKKQQ